MLQAGMPGGGDEPFEPTAPGGPVSGAGARAGAGAGGCLSVEGPWPPGFSMRSFIDVEVRPSAATISLKSCGLEATRIASAIDTRPA